MNAKLTLSFLSSTLKSEISILQTCLSSNLLSISLDDIDELIKEKWQQVYSVIFLLPIQ